MRALRFFALGAVLLASPAFAADWRVESLSGDAVTLKQGAEAEALDVGSVVKEGATVVSGPLTTVTLARRGDVVSIRSDAIVNLFPGSGTTRALVEAKAGKIEVKAASGDDGALEVATRFFRVDAQSASFSVDAHKEFADVDVGGGSVEVQDMLHGGAPVVIGSGGEFHGVAKAADPAKDAKDKDAAARDASADAAMKELDKANEKLGGKDGKGKKNSALLKKLAAKGALASKDGLEELAEEYEAAAPPEVPKIGILTFLFGPGAPSAAYVAPALIAVFLLFGGITSAVLRGVSFGLFGNALVLLVGALVGAAVHDFLFPPEAFWAYEPTPGIVTPTFFAFATLVGACFARRYLEERIEQAEAAQKAALAAKGNRRPRSLAG